MRLAILADIHGNLHALEAAVAEIEKLEPDHVILDGDLINALPFSAEVIDFVRKQDWTVVRGNHEFYYLDYGTERARPGMDDPNRWGQLHWLMKHINQEQGNYLAALPDDLTLYYRGVQPIRVAHGVPGHNRVGFYNEQPEAEIVADVEDIVERTVISAHTHVQVDRQVSLFHADESDLLSDPHSGAGVPGNGEIRRWHVINPGSVGLPLNGDGRAQFAIIDSVDESVEAGGWIAQHFSVPYDRRSTLEAFHSSGMLAVGGVITELFYWELVTSGPEIIRFYQWSRANGYDPDEDLDEAFAAYVARSGRSEYVQALDPLQGGRGVYP